VAEREKQAEKDRVAEIEAKRALEDRKRQTLKVNIYFNIILLKLKLLYLI
jgi:hypothetical protein